MTAATFAIKVPAHIVRVMDEAVAAYRAVDFEIRRNLNPGAKPEGEPILSPRGIQAVLERRQREAVERALSVAPPALPYRTTTHFLRELAEHGIAINAWAQGKGFESWAAYAVAAKRGERK